MHICTRQFYKGRVILSFYLFPNLSLPTLVVQGDSPAIFENSSPILQSILQHSSFDDLHPKFCPNYEHYRYRVLVVQFCIFFPKWTVKPEFDLPWILVLLRCREILIFAFEFCLKFLWIQMQFYVCIFLGFADELGKARKVWAFKDFYGWKK